MADEVQVGGVEYISSKRASEVTGYAQDYIGQLARGGYIDAKRIGGLWHVSLRSLEEYGKNASEKRAKPPERQSGDEPDSLISFDGQDYVSASRAAKITGYHQDYIGQLARNNLVASRLVGNRWYVGRDALLTHKSEKDRLLAAVQSESVGLPRREIHKEIQTSGELNRVDNYPGISPKQPGFRSQMDLTYTHDKRDLIPNPVGAERSEELTTEGNSAEMSEVSKRIPIRSSRGTISQNSNDIAEDHQMFKISRIPGNTKNYRRYYLIVGIVAGVLIFLFIGMSFMVRGSSASSGEKNALFSGPAKFLEPVANFINYMLSSELYYKRGQ